MQSEIRALVAAILALASVVGLSSPAHAQGGDPIGSFDATSVRLSYVFYYGLSTWQISGWAADPDAPGQPIDVHVYLDGERYGVIHTGGNRPDVHAVFPELGNAGGFDDVIAVVPGQHIYCLDIGNSGHTGADNPSLGCGLVDVPPGDARGSWDATTIEPVHPDGRFGSTTYEGWAWDPGLHPATVRMRLVWTGFNSAFLRTQSVSDYQTGEPRPDVQQAFPAAPPDTGWKISFADEGIYTATTPTDVYRCFYVVTSAEEQLISCAPLTTRTVDSG